MFYRSLFSAKGSFLSPFYAARVGSNGCSCWSLFYRHFSLLHVRRVLYHSVVLRGYPVGLSQLCWDIKKRRAEVAMLRAWYEKGPTAPYVLQGISFTVTALSSGCFFHLFHSTISDEGCTFSRPGLCAPSASSCSNGI
jgi:hypothetical protein